MLPYTPQNLCNSKQRPDVLQCDCNKRATLLAAFTNRDIEKNKSLVSSRAPQRIYPKLHSGVYFTFFLLRRISL